MGTRSGALEPLPSIASSVAFYVGCKLCDRSLSIVHFLSSFCHWAQVLRLIADHFVIERNSEESSAATLVYIILPMLERIRPRIRPVFSTILQMPDQLISLALPQDQNKATSQNKCDASHHQNTLMSVVNTPYTTWQYLIFAILLSLLLFSTCHENTHE